MTPLYPRAVRTFPEDKNKGWRLPGRWPRNRRFTFSMTVLSALDFKTDMALRKALKKETSDATVLIVTQRVSTIMGAEQIVVLDNGEIAGIGTHKDLMKTCKVYQEIALSQLSKEELA